MPYLIKPDDVAFLAGWCMGPVQYGTADMLLFERIWQAYQDVDGVVHVRRSNSAKTAWDFEDIPDGLEGYVVRYPDIAFDKAGQLVIAFQQGNEIWVRRVSVVESVRTVIVEKIATNASHPVVCRDFAGDILVFYGDITDPLNTVLKWRVQAEGWQTEYVVPTNLVGKKYPLDAMLGRDNTLVILFADANGDIWYVTTPRYPIAVGGGVLAAATAIAGLKVFAITSRFGVGGILAADASIAALELLSNDIRLAVAGGTVNANAAITSLIIITITSVYRSVAGGTVSAASAVVGLNLYNIIPHQLNGGVVSSDAAITALELLPV